MDALEARLQQTEGFSHFVRSSSVTEALGKLEYAPVSLVLVDVHLSAAHDPLVSIPLLRARSPNARIALFSGSTDHGLVRRAMSHGADGFVFKGMSSRGLVDAIVRLARGEQVWAADAD
jgi:DNA-binding NarL/FixJ family response regulator